MNDKIVHDIRSSYGEGGASNTSKYICNLLKEKRRSRYKLLETDMRRLKKKVSEGGWEISEMYAIIEDRGTQCKVEEGAKVVLARS